MSGVELTVKPFGREFYQPLGESMVFTCELELTAQEKANNGANVEYTIRWFDLSNKREITDRTGRLVLPLPFTRIATAAFLA